MPRPTARFARVVIMATLLSAPVVGTAVAAWFLPTVAVAAVMAATVSASFIVVLKVLNPADKAGGVAGACVVAASIAAIFAVPLLILRVRGEHDLATVTAERVSSSHSGPTYKYRLVTAGGQKIPGELSEPDDEFSVGDHVPVVFDPRGVANPHDDDFVGLGLPLAGATLVLLVTTIVLCVPATAVSARSRE
jgi:hypothetical protein